MHAYVPWKFFKMYTTTCDRGPLNAGNVVGTRSNVSWNGSRENARDSISRAMRRPPCLNKRALQGLGRWNLEWGVFVAVQRSATYLRQDRWSSYMCRRMCTTAVALDKTYHIMYVISTPVIRPWLMHTQNAICMRPAVHIRHLMLDSACHIHI